jgi:hypothetical protein
MGFRNYPIVRFKEVDTKDETQLQRVATRLMELGLMTPQQGMDVINKGVFPNSEEVDKSQEKFIEQRKQGYYNPLVGGAPMMDLDDDLGEPEKTEQTVPGTPGRPSGTTGIPQEIARSEISAKNITNVIHASEKLETFGTESFLPKSGFFNLIFLTLSSVFRISFTSNVSFLELFFSQGSID